MFSLLSMLGRATFSMCKSIVKHKPARADQMTQVTIVYSPVIFEAVEKTTSWINCAVLVESKSLGDMIVEEVW